MPTKKKASKAKQPTDPILPGLAVGERLLAGFKEELTTLKNPGNSKQNIWETLSEVQQDEILDRFGRRISHHFRLAFEVILAGGVPAVQSTLSPVTFGSKGIKGSLEIPAGSGHRHELADFSGKQVLVILTDELDEYLESMSAVKPDKDQAELPLADNDAEKDSRTVDELRGSACTLARDIGELSVAEDMGDNPHQWTRERLVDYIEFASEKAEANG